jgi:hypothetical protein
MEIIMEKLIKSLFVLSSKHMSATAELYEGLCIFVESATATVQEEVIPVIQVAVQESGLAANCRKAVANIQRLKEAGEEFKSSLKTLSSAASSALTAEIAAELEKESEEAA